MSKLLSIHQPAYLPWPGYFHKIMVSDVFVVLDTTQFEKNSYINRNRVKSAQGPLWLTVPVRTKGGIPEDISNVEIVPDRWEKKHRATLEQAYAKAINFDRVYPALRPFYERRWTLLGDLCREMLSWFVELLEIETEIVYASQRDFRSKKGDLVLEIAESLGAASYLSGALGRDYLSAERFEERGISLNFQDYRCNPYPQLHDGFIPGLSVVDMMLNVGAHEARNLILAGNATRQELVG